MADLLETKEGDLLILTLNRPEKRNALTMEMLLGLEKALEHVAEDASVRTIIVAGAGETAFCAGIDLGTLFEHLSSQPSGEKLRKVQRRLQEIFNRLEEAEKPTIAAIEGACVGGGLELALSCDFRVSGANGKFGFPEAKIGMIPDLGGTVRIARLIGPSRAKEWVFTGRQYTAEQAHALGVVNEVAAPGKALEKARALAKEISLSAPLAVGWGKRVIDRSIGMTMHSALELEQDAMTELLPSDDLKEGVMAFLEKRPAKFTGA